MEPAGEAAASPVGVKTVKSGGEDEDVISIGNGLQVIQLVALSLIENISKLVHGIA
jgi:hypothetical protein